MVTRAKITTKGFEEYLEKLAEAGKNVDERVARALRAGAEVARDGMVKRVRKDTHNLEEHIGVTEVRQDGNYVFVQIGVLDADDETARYGNAQEYGTSSMAAQSYIRATMDEDAAKIKRAMKDEFEGEA
jgi:HK97 gp10 family phage protein